VACALDLHDQQASARQAELRVAVPGARLRIDPTHLHPRLGEPAAPTLPQERGLVRALCAAGDLVERGAHRRLVTQQRAAPQLGGQPTRGGQSLPHSAGHQEQHLVRRSHSGGRVDGGAGGGGPRRLPGHPPGIDRVPQTDPRRHLTAPAEPAGDEHVVPPRAGLPAP
jgi:hypothetical protein